LIDFHFPLDSDGRVYYIHIAYRVLTDQ
jgi:hypothetical protein